MKLSELVAFRNQLNQLSVIPSQTSSAMEIAGVHYLMSSSPEQFANFKSQFDLQASVIHDQFNKFEDLLTQLKQQVNDAITEDEKHWFRESYNLYDNEMCHETTEYILNRRETLSEDVRQLFTTRLQNYTDWRFPGMIVRPGLETFVHNLVSADPLYLIDQHRDLVQPTVNRFPEAYQRRLRTYIINERNTDPILYKIPDNQFGLCLIYNFFNFRPIEVIRQWLTEIFNKLRPGGVLIMTINDCDQAAGVMLVENYFACYTPGKLILTLAESLGFEVLYTWNNKGPMTWIELSKPGELDGLRGGQTLAKIIAKPVAKSK